MSDRRDPSQGERVGALALRRQHSDPFFWTKLTALWHRERVRDAFVSAGYSTSQARKRANQEALEVARQHGWRGDLAELKWQLSELLDPKVPPAARRWGGVQYWESKVQEDVKHLLAAPASALKTDVVQYLRRQARIGGRFAGQTGLYKLGYIVGHTPPIEHLDRRNAFIEALSEVGNDPDCCDPELFRVVFRVLRPYTLQPFEARVGFSMPDEATGKRAAKAPREPRRRKPRKRRGLIASILFE